VAHRFLTKPCGAAELQDAIERVCALQEIMYAPELRRIVGAIGELPSLSRTYASLAQAVSDPNTSISRVADIIEQDLAMSAKVLQLVNSAFYGLAQNATSLRSAAGYLGMETIKNLALATETFRVLAPHSSISESVCETIQKHAYSTAAIVAKLPLDPKIRDGAVVAALLHDVGKLILASRMPTEFCSTLALARERKCEPFEAEEEILGTSHAEIGAYLLGLWGIPNHVVEAIAHHHHPTRVPHSGFDSSLAVYVANLLAHGLDDHPQDLEGFEPREADRAVLETLGILPRFDEFRKSATQIHN
jgi:putative nucleotidyltransferase with HDIG domain